MHNVSVRENVLPKQNKKKVSDAWFDLRLTVKLSSKKYAQDANPNISISNWLVRPFVRAAVQTIHRI